MHVTDGVENTQENAQVQAETTATTNTSNNSEERVETLRTFEDLLKNPEYKASYDKRVNDLLLKKQEEWGKNFEKTKAEEFENKTKELMQKAQLEAMDLRIENALLLKGVDSSKSSRLKRLVDKSLLIDDKGVLDGDKLNSEIETILKEFPELSSKNEEKKGFVIGGDGNQETKKDEMADIRKVMGLK